MQKRALIIINFKDYKESIGNNAIKLAKELDNKNVWLIINAIDLKEVIKNVKHSKILIEHADPINLNTSHSHTGAVTFEEVKKAKAYGILLNHSEKRISFYKIKEGIKLARKYKLKIIICSSNLNEALKINKLKPDYLAIEPPELISGKISISESKPKLIEHAAKKIKNLIVGAGIHNRKDIETAMILGAKGILISSAIVKAKNPKEKLEKLIKN